MMSGSQLHQVRIRSGSLFALRMCERLERIVGGTHHRWRQRAEPQSMRRCLNINVLAAYALVTLALAYFGVMASRHIALPGLNVDEVLGVRPAVGGPVARSIFGIPVLTISYIGALKSYIYFPIFALFGGSPETIRLPTIFISLLTLALTFKLSRLHFRPSYSALLVLLMAADPIFIFMSKADYGPIVLMMFFKMLALACIPVAMAAATSTSVSNNQPAAGPNPAIKTAMQPDLTLKSVLAPGTLLPLASQDSTVAIKRGSCRCGCGGVCFTDADCGPGGVCDPFPSCCAKDSQISIIQEGAALSSHKSGEPAINVKCN